jgi:uncharacterized protein YecE (DUF72 family)
MTENGQPDLFDFGGVPLNPRPALDLTVPEYLRPCLRIGTCSWKYDSWKGLLYDEGKAYRSGDYLHDYARHLGTVEIDQWFWSLFPTGVRLPDRGTVRQYADSVPDDFLFTVKAPNALTLTHYYGRQPKEHAAFANRPNEQFLDLDLLNRFLERLAPMEGKLGPVMLQFEYLNRAKMPSRKEFLDRLDQFLAGAPKGFQYVVELRNPNYLSREFFDLLGRHGAGYVFLEGYFMPRIGEVWRGFQPSTAEFAVVRLHGSDRSDIEKRTGEKWNRVVDPKPDALTATAEIVLGNVARGVTTFVNVNNHFEGSAPLTIGRLLARLGEAEGQ